MILKSELRANSHEPRRARCRHLDSRTEPPHLRMSRPIFLSCGNQPAPLGSVHRSAGNRADQEDHGHCREPVENREPVSLAPSIQEPVGGEHDNEEERRELGRDRQTEKNPTQKQPSPPLLLQENSKRDRAQQAQQCNADITLHISSVRDHIRIECEDREREKSRNRSECALGPPRDHQAERDRGEDGRHARCEHDRIRVDSILIEKIVPQHDVVATNPRVAILRKIKSPSEQRQRSENPRERRLIVTDAILSGLEVVVTRRDLESFVPRLGFQFRGSDLGPSHYHEEDGRSCPKPESIYFQRRSHRSSLATPHPTSSTTALSTAMPANTPVVSNVPSACEIR